MIPLERNTVLFFRHYFFPLDGGNIAVANHGLFTVTWESLQNSSAAVKAGRIKMWVMGIHRARVLLESNNSGEKDHFSETRKDRVILPFAHNHGSLANLRSIEAFFRGILLTWIILRSKKYSRATLNVSAVLQFSEWILGTVWKFSEETCVLSGLMNIESFSSSQEGLAHMDLSQLCSLCIYYRPHTICCLRFQRFHPNNLHHSSCVCYGRLVCDGWLIKWRFKQSGILDLVSSVSSV